MIFMWLKRKLFLRDERGKSQAPILPARVTNQDTFTAFALSYPLTDSIIYQTSSSLWLGSAGEHVGLP